MAQAPVQFSKHQRDYGAFLYAYPVISRRSKGLSIGLNLNPDKVCNWDCPYCQVDRTVPPRVRDIDQQRLIEEVQGLTQDAVSGRLWEHPRFETTPAHLRVIRDFALAGDGEPTSYRGFPDIIAALIAVRRDMNLESVPIIVLTNATLFHQPHVRKGLELLEHTTSDLWVKLDAGTQSWFERMNASQFPLTHCIDNIVEVARRRPVTVQSMFLAMDGQHPDAAQIDAYVGQLRSMRERGAAFKAIQIYTIARRPADDRCQVLPDTEVDDIAARVRAALGDVPVEAFYGRNPA